MRDRNCANRVHSNKGGDYRMKQITVIVFLTALFVSVLGCPSEARPRRIVDASGNDTQIIGGRPSGCPFRFCGCGLRKYLGLDDKRLDLASNWPRYYRGDRMIAVWHHHVALVERLVAPGIAILRDYNSGGGLSRVHVRSIAGAHIINQQYAAYAP
jgi:hypothetical protein